MANVHLLQGRPQAARGLIEGRPVEGTELLSGTSSSNTWYEALIEHTQGNVERADAALAKFIAENGDERPLSVACLHAWRGDKDAAFHWLDRALTLHPELSVKYSWEPWLDSLENDPRWAELMQRWTGTVTYRKV